MGISWGNERQSVASEGVATVNSENFKSSG